MPELFYLFWIIRFMHLIWEKSASLKSVLWADIVATNLSSKAADPWKFRADNFCPTRLRRKSLSRNVRAPAKTRSCSSALPYSLCDEWIVFELSSAAAAILVGVRPSLICASVHQAIRTSQELCFKVRIRRACARQCSRHFFSGPVMPRFRLVDVGNLSIGTPV